MSAGSVFFLDTVYSLCFLCQKIVTMRPFLFRRKFSSDWQTSQVYVKTPNIPIPVTSDKKVSSVIDVLALVTTFAIGTALCRANLRTPGTENTGPKYNKHFLHYFQVNGPFPN